MMTPGQDEGMPLQYALPNHRRSSTSDFDTHRFANRLTGLLFVAAGALILATSVVDFLDGRWVRAVLTAVAGSASLIGGAMLCTLDYSSVPDALRRGPGIGAMAIGPGLTAFALVNL